jgi:uncharacterized repeat protein (TIGR03847 family)
MPDPRPLGPVEYVVAEAIGQPGQRRFRLQALTGTGVSASLWLEKEQLNALGDAIQTVLESEAFEYAAPPPDDAPLAPVFPLNADVDFRVGQLSMGVDRESRRIVLIGTEAGDEEEALEAVSFEFGFNKGFELRRQITSVVAAGRPPCPLCSAPLDPTGHVCPRSNGHHPQE